MVTDYFGANDAIYNKFNEAWNDGRVLALIGKEVQIVWRGVELETPPAANDFWVRVSQNTIIQRQSSLAGFDSSRRFTTKGTVFVELFCPKSNQRGFELGGQLAVIARNVFRYGIDSEGIFFRNARIKELPEERDTYRYNVVAEYEYDEIVR